MERVLCLIHGFGTEADSMKCFERLFKEEAPDVYDRFIYIELYDGNRGFDFTGSHNVASPIFADENYYDMDDEKYPSLTTKFKKDLEAQLTEAGEIDFICHSTGGLVLRAYLKYGFNPQDVQSKQGYFINDKYKVNKVILLGVPNHGTILANRWFSRFGGTVVNTIYRIIVGLREAVENVTEEIPDLKEGEINQLKVGSQFIKRLNQGLEALPYIRWFTFRGELNRWFVGNLLFSYWLFGLIPTFWPERSNDEVLQSKSVILRGAEVNYKVRWADHGVIHDLYLEDAFKRIKSPKKQQKVKETVEWMKKEIVKIMKDY